MDITVSESTLLNCDGHFEVTVKLSCVASARDPIKVRIIHQPQYDRDVQAVQLDHESFMLLPGGHHDIVVTGLLAQRCKAGQFNIAWFRTIEGVEVPGTREDLLFGVPPVPFHADDDPDPVVADPAGVFRYTVTLKCCTNGVPAQLRSVDYQTSSVDVAHYRAVPGSPITLDCPDQVKLINVTGILDNPRRPGSVRVQVSGGGRCSVVTTIKPNASPNRAAHRLALDEWDD